MPKFNAFPDERYEQLERRLAHGQGAQNPEDSHRIDGALRGLRQARYMRATSPEGRRIQRSLYDSALSLAFELDLY